MSFVKKSIDYIHSIYDNYFESNAKTTLNNYELEQHTNTQNEECYFEKNKDNYNDDDDEDKMCVETPNNLQNTSTNEFTHVYNTRSKKNKNHINNKENTEKSLYKNLVIDTTFHIEDSYSSEYDNNKNTKNKNIKNINNNSRSNPSSPLQIATQCASPEERILHLETTIKGLELSINNSKTAKGGYIEEERVLQDLNDQTELSSLFFKTFFPLKMKKDYNNFAKFKRHPNSVCKTDIINVDQNILIQIKRYDIKCCYGQIDRHWVDDFIYQIPNIKPVSFMLRNLCEIPLISGTNLVDKDIGRIPLSLDYYSDSQLKSLLTELNNNIVDILRFVLKGSDIDTSPNYLMGIEYDNDIRIKTVIYKMDDVIDVLSKKFRFRIKSRCTVITLGDIISIQRKGGDNGLRASNQLQWKLRFSALSAVIPTSKRLEFYF